MTHIDELEAILENITSYSIIQGTITPTNGIYLQPSDVYNHIPYLETEFFDVVIMEDTLAALQTKKTLLLTCVTALSFDYTSYAATYPFYVDARVIQYHYPIEFDSIGNFTCWIRFEARWSL